MNSLARARRTFARRIAGAFAVEPWWKLSLRHVLAGLVLGGLVSAMHLFSSLVPLREYGVANLIHTAVSDQVGAFCIMLAVLAADYAKGDDSGHRAIYVLAVLVGAGLWAVLEYAGFRSFGVGVRWYSAVLYQYTDAEEAAWRTVYGFLEWLLIGGAATFIYLDARRASAEQARLRRAEVDRALTAKRMLESQLQAMQARVEPQFLFNTMAQVRRLYDIDFSVAERMLEDLIAYLRAAMPRMRDTTSTVAREIGLARAYLDIVKLRLGKLRFEIRASEKAIGARMPPMMLLPLIDHAIAHGLGSTEDGGVLRIGFEIAGGSLRIGVEDSVGALAQDTGSASISGIHERLTALYGADGKVELPVVDARPARALLEIPLEMADRGECRMPAAPGRESLA